MSFGERSGGRALARQARLSGSRFSFPTFRNLKSSLTVKRLGYFKLYSNLYFQVPYRLQLIRALGERSGDWPSVRPMAVSEQEFVVRAKSRIRLLEKPLDNYDHDDFH